MTREETVRIIRLYACMPERIRAVNRKINETEDICYNTLKGIAYDDDTVMSSGNETSGVERTVMRIPDGVSSELASLRRLSDIYCRFCKEVSECIMGLDEPIEAAVIEQFYIKDLSWVSISIRNNYSERSLQRVRDRAVIKLSREFDKNEYIKRFSSLRLACRVAFGKIK